MIPQEKINLLDKAMEVKKRADGTEFTCFSDTAPHELKDIFLEHYEVRDQDYEIFSTAIDTIIEAWNNNEDSPTLLWEYIHENYNDFASVYTADRLAYLTIHNQEDISKKLREYDCDIADACAFWYDEQVHEACTIIINEYVMK